MKSALRLCLAAAALYVAAVSALYAYQRELMYFPEQTARRAPSDYAMLEGVREVALETADGLTILAWHALAPEGRPTVVLFPGNATALSGLRYRIAGFLEAGMGVLALGYRGYSGGDGAPSEDGLYTDARAALDFLDAQGVAPSALALYGHSLGTGVASKMAAEREIGALILEAPFSSAVDIAAWRYPYAPVDWLMTDRFDSIGRIASIDAPLLVMHGDADEVIPQRFGRALFEAAREPKQGYWPMGAAHSNVFDLGGFDRARAFIERHVARAPVG